MSVIGIGPGFPAGYASVSSASLYHCSPALTDASGPLSATVTANKAYYYPIRIGEAMVIALLWAFNGDTAAGNTDVGIYDVAGTRIISSGSTAMSGTSTRQTFDVADTLIGPGVYYLAIASNSATATFIKWSQGSWSVANNRMAGNMEQASAFALPATATFAAATESITPICGFTGRTVI